MSVAQGQRIVLVEYLRGLAALSVAWFHLTNGYTDWVARAGSYGWLGVEVFFVITGLVIPLSLASDWKRQGLRALPHYLLRRIVRIEPPYIISVLIVVCLNLIVMRVPGFQGKFQQYPLEQILLHAAYLIPLSSYDWLQPVYWTLAYEFGFYFSVALIMVALVNVNQWPFLALLLLLLGFAAVKWVSPLLVLFGVGCVVFRCLAGLVSLQIGVSILALCTAAMCYAGAVEQAVVGATTATALLVNRYFDRFVEGAELFEGLGKISFSLYLLHVPVGGKIVNLGQRWLTSPVEHLLLSVIALAASLVAASMFWRWVEYPCIALSRRIGRRPLMSQSFGA